jgi:flagellar biosynthetic protein FliQ
MNAEAVGDLLEQSLAAVFQMSAPMLLVGLVVGVSISLFQAATQIQEVTLVFVPKIIAVGLAMWIAGPFIFETIEHLIREIFMRVNEVGDQTGI